MGRQPSRWGREVEKLLRGKMMKPVMFEVSVSGLCGDEYEWVPALQDAQGRVHVLHQGHVTVIAKPRDSWILPFDTMDSMRADFDAEVKAASDRFGNRLGKFLKRLEDVAEIRKRLTSNKVPL